MSIQTKKQNIKKERIKFSELKARFISSFDEFLTMEKDWNELLAKSSSDTVFLRHEWFRCWWKAFGGDNRLFIIIVESGKQLTGIAPFMLVEEIQRGICLKKIKFIANDNSPRCDLILSGDEQKNISKIFELLKANQDLWDVIVLEEISEESRTIEFLIEYFKNCDYKYVIKSGKKAPFIRIDQSWDEFYSKKSAKFRKVMRNKINRVSRLGCIKLEKIMDIRQDESVLEKISDISRNSWKANCGGELGRSQENKGFFQDITLIASQNGWLNIWLLSITKDKSIAYEYHLKYKNKTYALRADFDEKFKDYNPGSVLEKNVIEQSFNDKLTEYDFCGDAYDYKMRWTEQVHGQMAFEIFSRGKRANKLYWLEYQLLPVLRKIGVNKMKNNLKNAKKAIRFFKQIYSELIKATIRQVNFYTCAPKKGVWFLTFRCTSRCGTCTVWKRPKNDKPELTLEEWKRIADKLISRGMESVEIFGGDVLLRKDILFELIKYLKQKHLTVYMPTNCNLLDEETAAKLVESGADKLYLSTDGVGNEHDIVRGVDGTFNRVSHALHYLKQARGAKKYPRLVCNTTVSKFNIDFLEDIAGFAVSAGYDELHYEYVGEMTEEQISNSCIDGLRPTPYYVRQEETVLLNKQKAKELKQTLNNIKNKFRIKIPIKTINIEMLSEDDLIKGSVPVKKCYVERNEVSIDPYGNVIICPFINNYVLGNLKREDFKNIWNNKKHKRFRELQNNGRIEICKHCILSAQRSHTFFGRMKRIWRKNILDGIKNFRAHEKLVANNKS